MNQAPPNPTWLTRDILTPNGKKKFQDNICFKAIMFPCRCMHKGGMRIERFSSAHDGYGGEGGLWPAASFWPKYCSTRGSLAPSTPCTELPVQGHSRRCLRGAVGAHHHSPLSLTAPAPEQWPLIRNIIPPPQTPLTYCTESGQNY